MKTANFKKNIEKKIIVILTSVLFMFVLAACGEKTIEDYYSKASAKAEIDGAMKQSVQSSNGVYSDGYIECSGNTFTYVYVYSDAVEYNSTADKLMKSEFSKVMPDEIKSMKQETGIAEKVTINVIFKNSKGQEVYKYSFEG